MDGTTKDNVSNGRLFRPGSLAQVLEEYPHVVLSILRGSRVASEGAGEQRVYTLYEPGKPEASHRLRQQDFERCVAVAKRLGSVQIFRSEPRADTFDRIRAHLKVEFADRTDP